MVDDADRTAPDVASGAVPAPARPLGPVATAAIVVALGAAVGLAGDATHVASGTTTYEWSGVPVIWESQIWFPVLLASAVLGLAWVGSRVGLPSDRVRTRPDAIIGAGLVLALYALTALLRGEPATVTVVLTGAIAIAIWAWWDPSDGAFALGLVAAGLGPAAEALLVELGAATYADDDLAGVAPWLPCLYFAAGAVASGLWSAIAGSPPTGTD